MLSPMSGSKNPVYASFSRRVLGHLIDESVVIVFCGLLYLVNQAMGFPIKYSTIFQASPNTSSNSFPDHYFPGLILIYFLVKLFLTYPYFALSESSPLQATLGKLAVGIKVTDLGGRRISFGRASGRFFLKALHSPLLMLPYVIAFSDQKQVWHDYVTKTLVVRKNIFPAIYALPRYPSRWLFDWPKAGEPGSSDKIEAASPGYTCMFCQYRSSEKRVGCPSCGMAFGYGEIGAMKALQLMQGIIFTLIGCLALYEGVHLALGEIQGTYGEIPLWVFALLFAFGGVFAAGGLSSFFGRSWLIRWLLLTLTRGRT
jgi:uncharacterized RDD family membrane protein YckC